MDGQGWISPALHQKLFRILCVKFLNARSQFILFNIEINALIQFLFPKNILQSIKRPGKGRKIKKKGKNQFVFGNFADIVVKAGNEDVAVVRMIDGG